MFFHKRLADPNIHKDFIERETEKLKQFKKYIEVRYLSRFSPTVAFLVKYKFMQREVIDLFQNYSYLTSDYIQKILRENQPFPSNSYTSSSFLDLSVNIFEIPYSTLLGATQEFFEKRAPTAVDQFRLRNFITTIFHQYNFVPYHNFSHGACVMQLFQNMIDQSESFRKLLSSEEQFIFLLICLCHDNSHPGTNNGYQIKRKTSLSYYFYQKSVLENYHIVQMLRKLD